MINTNNNPDTLTQMLDLCRQVYPYLDGQYQAENNDNLIHFNQPIWLNGTAEDRFTIEQVYQDIKQSAPEADHAYYLTRTWDLLCWQPVYVAFIAIYGLQQLPDFSHFKQQRQHHSITGFTFQSSAMTSAKPEQLIALAAKQLSQLLEHYRYHLDNLYRCRPGYVKHLLADLIIGNLVKVEQYVPHFSIADLQHHTQLWLNAFGLPEKLKNTIEIANNQSVIHTRQSCCLTYKANNNLCENCPKQVRT